MSVQRHSWLGEMRKTACDTASGCDETWRACQLCGLVKITVHVPHEHPYRAWRFPDGARRIDPATPECVPLEKVSE